MENIEKAVTDQLKAIPVSDYQRCYEDWKQRLRRCVAFQGNYFEGDKLDLYFKSNYRVILNQSHYFIYRPCTYWTFSMVLLSCWNRRIRIRICLFHNVQLEAKCTLHCQLHWINIFSDDWRKGILRNCELWQLIRKCSQGSTLPGVLLCCPCKFLLSQQQIWSGFSIFMLRSCLRSCIILYILSRNCVWSPTFRDHNAVPKRRWPTTQDGTFW